MTGGGKTKILYALGSGVPRSLAAWFRESVFVAFALLFMVPATQTLAKSSSVDPLTIIVAETSNGKFSWMIELADDDRSRATGLMNRQEMTPFTGMLFRFDRSEPIAMWMKNTFIPLDMVFTDEAGRVTHIHKSAVPQSLDIIESRGPVKFVLEVNAGEADAAGLKTGTVLKHPWFAAQ